MGLKKCSFCAEEIKEEAIKCRWCGEFLHGEREDVGKTIADALLLIQENQGRMNDFQRELMVRFLHLTDTDCAEILGGVTRMMLEPGAEFWDALHKVFEVREGNQMMSSMPS